MNSKIQQSNVQSACSTMSKNISSFRRRVQLQGDLKTCKLRNLWLLQEAASANVLLVPYMYTPCNENLKWVLMQNLGGCDGEPVGFLSVPQIGVE